MEKTLIVYGSTIGNTENAAKNIQSKLEGSVLMNVGSVSAEEIANYSNILFGSSTWGYGDLQDDWSDVIADFGNIDLSGKKVAFFGTGDQESYADTFADAIGIIHDALQNSNAEFVGTWPADGYHHVDSKAVRDGIFLGLVLDEDNQPDLTEERILKWVEQLKSQLL